MTIDREKLVELLVEKTSMKKEEIETQLDQLIERILDAAKREKALEIKEFGLFYFNENGQLKFDPSNEISTEISFRYAGMKPVILKPERDTSIPADIEENQDEAEKEEEKTTTQEKKHSSAEPVRKNSKTGVFILIAIVLIAVLVGGYFYYIGTQSQDLTDASQSSVTEMDSETDAGDISSSNMADPDESVNDLQQTESEGVTSNENQSAGEQAETNLSTDEEMESNAEISSSETDQPIYGLNGSVIEEANNGYSIVVHSLRDETNALETAEELRADNYRVIVSSRIVYENQVWRVSVGQFETISDAQQAATELPEPYNTQNFIQRIRIN